MNTSQKIIFSGVQPSGNLHLGNYLGAIKQWVSLQDDYSCIFCVVDYHAITLPQDPKKLKDKIVEVAKIYLAAGIDPKKTIIFQQSDIKEHTELAWILNCAAARMSDLENMTQYKDKSIDVILLKKILENATDKKFIRQLEAERNNVIHENYRDEIKTIKDPKERIVCTIIKNIELKNVSEDIRDILLKVILKAFNEYREEQKNTGVGLFDYPVLMAADILLYNTDVVPVGEDQIQHVELTRDLAKRFNNQFGQTFKIPEYKIKKESARIMGLDDPTKKMSKSAESEYNYIALTDDPEKAAKKILRATTDSGSEIKLDWANKPGISNLLIIYSLLTDRKISEIEAEFAGSGYGEFKKKLAEIVKKFLTNFQTKYKAIDDNEVQKILDSGAKKLQKIATAKIKEVKKGLGIL